MMTPEQKKADILKKKLEVLRNDFELYAKINLKIKDKDGELKPFLFNMPQKFLHAAIEKQLAEKGKVRILGLKGRQQGFSTYTEGRFYWRTSLNPGKSAFILTHEIPATDNLFKMAKRYHDNSHPELRPHTGNSNVKELIFDKIDSGYKVGTAAAKATGRSGTHQYFHGSEVSAWENAYDHFAGVLQCIPKNPGTEIILETTARGASGKFYDLWMEAMDPDTPSEYIAVFVPWYMTPEYREPAPLGFEPTEDEKKKMAIYGVDHDQLYWRRLNVADMGKDLCDQEYPYCWQDAFLASGRTRFDTDDMQAALKECYRPKWLMDLENGKFIESKNAKAKLKVWEKPATGLRYSVGGDVALGLEGKDYSSLDVVEVRTGRQVAQWHGHCEPSDLATVAYALGKWYNNALLCIENATYGGTTNVRLRDMNYPNIYVMTLLLDRGSDQNETRQLGFNTNRSSKRMVIDDLAALFREHITGIVCKETIEECLTFLIKEDESLGAAPKRFDDRVISYALAQYGARQSPAYKKAHKR